MAKQIRENVGTYFCWITDERGYCGAIVADGADRIGWSICSEKDKFDPILALVIAGGRAEKWGTGWRDKVQGNPAYEEISDLLHEFSMESCRVLGNIGWGIKNCMMAMEGELPPQLKELRYENNSIDTRVHSDRRR